MKRFSMIAAAAIVLAGCAKGSQETAATPGLLPATAAAPTAQQIANVTVKGIVVTPPSVTAKQAVTVRAEFTDAPASMPATFAWFGPDGWLVVDDTRDVQQNSVTFTMNGDAFDAPGHYRGELRSGNVFLGEAALDVTG
jgi:hypothetical protein